MSEGLPYADIVILALIAGFVLLRLRGVLGQKIGHEKPPFKEYRASTSLQEEDSPVVQVEKAKQLERQAKSQHEEALAEIADNTTRDAIAAIREADKDFSLKHFLEGAKGAFDMVFDAFVKGDRDTLKMLLSSDLYEMFTQELAKRENGERRTETTLLSILSREVKTAALEKNLARITVRFVSEQVSVVRDGSGQIVEGNPGASEHVEDEWTFERDLNSRNPNWKIIDT